MGRRSVAVETVADDLGEVTGLWLDSRVDTGASREACSRTISDGRLAAALRRPGVTAVVGRLDGVPVGFVVTTDNPFGLSPGPEMSIEQLWVSPAARRHGVAKALLASVLAAAERGGCDAVVSNVPTTSRDANRFFARLGFGSVVTRRVVPTGTLRRRLAPETVETGLELTRRRRSLRRRAIVPPRSA